MKQITSILFLLGIILLLVGGAMIGSGVMGIVGIWGMQDSSIIILTAGGSAVTFLALLSFWSWFSRKKSERSWADVIGIAKSRESVTIDDISNQTGLSYSETSQILHEAIANGQLSGTVKENTFIRTEMAAPGTKTIEREVMVTRKVPEACFKCGAPLNPQEVEWTGPDSIRCPHCGATLSVTTERV